MTNSSHHLSDESNTTTDMMSNIYMCGACKHPVTWEEKGVLCEQCDVWFHICCQNIQSADYTKLYHSSVIWYCSSCNGPNYSTTSPIDIYESVDDPTPLQQNADSTQESIASVKSLDEECQPIHTSSPSKHKPNKPHGRPLRVINVNCQSLCGKKGAWRNLLSTSKPDIIIGTETWLNSSISNNELECEGFTVYRRDRVHGSHGGVMIAINSTLTSNEIKVRCVKNSEIIWVKLHCKGHRDILIASCYRPNVSDKVTAGELKESLRELWTSRQRPFGLIIGGDFNYPGWNWVDNLLKPGTSYVGLHHDFKDILDDYGLVQHITDPTRGANILDLIITNMPDQVRTVSVMPGISDHHIAYMELVVKPISKKQKPRYVWLYNKADWEGMRCFLRPRLERLSQAYNPSPDSMWTTMKDMITEATAMFIPKRRRRAKDSCPWVDKELRTLITTRERLFHRSKNGTARSEERYLMYRRLVQSKLRKKHAIYMHNLFTDESVSAKVRTKRFWTYIKSQKSATVPNVGPLRDENKLITSSEDMANLLNDQFVSVFSAQSQSHDNAQTAITDNRMSEIEISKEGILKLLRELDPHKAAGPDNMNPRVLREMADTLAEPLAILFQTSLDKARIPNDWKRANICPIYKKGERHMPANYRPISLTCITSKLMEHVITSKLMSFAEENNILFKNQHGFRKKKSCEKQLVELVADIAQNLDSGHQTEACLLDFSKAFDKVNHQKLITKLKNVGVNHQVTAWIEEFLRNRSQQVVIDGTASREAMVTSGVPQGSVIGPALFLFYINDLPEELSSTVRLFADDTILYNTEENHLTLQQDLEKLEEWETKWDMEFHPAKCQHITFTRKTKPPLHSFKLHSMDIPKDEEIKYLGVTIDSKLRCNKHVSNVTARGNSTLGFIRRNVTTTSEEVKSKAYKQLVRPTLEYAAGAWDSLTKTQENQIEAVQRRAARFVAGTRRTDRTTSTTSTLARLGWDTLQSRRCERRLRIFREMHFEDAEIVSRHLGKTATSSARSHQHQYLLPHSNTKHHQMSFFQKTAREWNKLPPSSSLLVAPG